MSELVSVIVPVYNIEDYLPRCLSCIKAQTYTNLEIILVDDGSTDGTGRLCDEYAASDPRARVIHHPENRGLWAARNTGQDAATGEYLWMPDGDDYFHKDIIKIMVEAINQTGSSGEKYDLAIVGCKWTSSYDEDISSSIIPLYREKTNDELFKTLVKPIENFSAFTSWEKLYRKHFLTGIYFNNYKYAQDRDQSIRVLLKEPKAIVIPNILYYYVQRVSSAVHSDDYLAVRSECETHFLCEIIDSMTEDKMKYRHYLFDYLYRSMANWLDFTDDSRVRYACRQIVKETGWEYLNSQTIKTPGKRVKRILRISFNRVYRLFGRGIISTHDESGQ